MSLSEVFGWSISKFFTSNIDPKIQESVGLYSIHLHSIKIKILVVLKRSFYISLWVILIMIMDILIIRIV